MRMWHKKHNPHLYNAAWKFLCVQDYVAYMLTGAEAVIDHTMAGRTMIFDSKKGVWNKEVLQIAGIEEEKLARPTASITQVGLLKKEIADAIRLKNPCAVIIGGHDQACGAIGSGVVQPGMLMDACGTVDAMVGVLETSAPRHAMLEHGLPIYQHADLKHFITLAINTNGGLFFKWYKNTFYAAESRIAQETGKDIYSEIISQSADDPSDMYILPHIEGAGSPYNDPESFGAIIGLRSGYTRRDISRAVLDSLGYEMNINLQAIERSTNQRIQEIRIIGGGSKTPKWIQIKANIFNKTITTLEINEAAVLGAAILGAVGIGFYADVETAIRHMVRVSRRYTPDPERAREYSKRFNEYEQLYDTLKTFNHRLSKRMRNM